MTTIIIIIAVIITGIVISAFASMGNASNRGYSTRVRRYSK